MAFYAVDVSARVIQRVTHEYRGMDKKRFFLIEAASEKQAWIKAGAAWVRIGDVICSSCRHRHCGTCAEFSVAEQFSDYWICHCCGALTERVKSLH